MTLASSIETLFDDLMKKLSPCQLSEREKSFWRWLASKQLQFLIVGLDIIKNSIRCNKSLEMVGVDLVAVHCGNLTKLVELFSRQTSLLPGS